MMYPAYLCAKKCNGAAAREAHVHARSARASRYAMPADVARRRILSDLRGEKEGTGSRTHPVRALRSMPTAALRHRIALFGTSPVRARAPNARARICGWGRPTWRASPRPRAAAPSLRASAARTAPTPRAKARGSARRGREATRLFRRRREILVPWRMFCGCLCHYYAGRRARISRADLTGREAALSSALPARARSSAGRALDF